MRRFLCLFMILCFALFAAGADDFTANFQQVISRACHQVFPTVVFIHVVKEDSRSGRDQGNIALGSGVLITADGELLTNHHVIDKARTIRCQLFDGTAYNAKVIGSDKDTDLALVKLELPENSPPLKFSQINAQDQLSEGDFVMAMGAPWGLNRSVTVGVISCATRYLQEAGDYSLWYQIDALILPGNSGGPLIDTNSKIIGINTLGGSSLGFAVPSPTINDIIPRLRQYGEVNWAWFGLQLQPLNDFLRNIHFPFKDGVIVAGTDPNSPARLSGLLPNDRIIAVNDEPVTVMNGEQLPNFRRRLGLFPFEVPVKFSLIRDGQTLEINLAPIAKGKVEGDEYVGKRWGLTVKTINRFDTPDLYYYRNDGIYIYGLASGGNAQKSGLRHNDIITNVNGATVTDTAQLKDVYEKAIAEIEHNNKAVISILRNGRQQQIVMDFLNDPERE